MTPPRPSWLHPLLFWLLFVAVAAATLMVLDHGRLDAADGAFVMALAAGWVAGFLGGRLL